MCCKTATAPAGQEQGQQAQGGQQKQPTRHDLLKAQYGQPSTDEQEYNQRRFKWFAGEAICCFCCCPCYLGSKVTGIGSTPMPLPPSGAAAPQPQVMTLT